MKPEDVSVIIPSLNEAARIESAIRSAWGNRAGEVIVCDGGSSDQTVEISKANGAVVIVSSPGRGQQLAAGAAAASRRILLFLHADNWLEAGCLELLCEISDERRVDGAFWGGFRQRVDAPSPVYRLLEWGNAMRIRLRGMPFGDQAMFVSRDLYERAGGFAAVPLMEDVRLAQSLRRICWPRLVGGRVHVDSRRWRKRGILRQTLRNWGIQIAHRFGTSEERLAKWYRR